MPTVPPLSAQALRGVLQGANVPPLVPSVHTYPERGNRGQVHVWGACHDLVGSQDTCGGQHPLNRPPMPPSTVSKREGDSSATLGKDCKSPTPHTSTMLRARTDLTTYLPAAVKPLAKAKASWPAPMKPTLMLSGRLPLGERGWVGGTGHWEPQIGER